MKIYVRFLINKVVLCLNKALFFVFQADTSMELRRGVCVSLEGTIDDLCALVDEVWHDWLIL